MPFCFGLILRSMEEDNSSYADYSLIAIYLTFLFASTIGTHVALNQLQHCAVRARVSITALIYEKVSIYHKFDN